MTCDPSLLDALVLGELNASEASAAAAHCKRCVSCARELSLLRAEREQFVARARRRAPAPSIRRDVMARCEHLAERARLRSRIVGGLGFALTLALVVGLAPLRQSETGFGASAHEVNASFCDPVETQTSFSRALHCGGGELVAQAETNFHACLVASPWVAGFGPEACE